MEKYKAHGDVRQLVYPVPPLPKLCHAEIIGGYKQ